MSRRTFAAFIDVHMTALPGAPEPGPDSERNPARFRRYNLRRWVGQSGCPVIWRKRISFHVPYL